jgi:hypothetical protein
MRGLVGILVLSLVAACGDDDIGSPGEYVTLAQFDAAYRDAECTYLVRCGLFPDQATCVKAHLFNAGAYSLSEDLRAEIAAGHVLYNGNNVKTCFDSIANATCDKTDEAGRGVNVACFQFLRGTVAGGGECLLGADCVSGDCRGSISNDPCVTGTCVGDTAPTVELPVNGQQCTTAIGCAQGSYCDSGTFECTPLKVAGDSCVDGRECAYGLGCVGVSRTCKALPASGEPCPDGLCRDDGLRCATTCMPLGLPGAMCQSSSDCSPYYTCDFSTTTPTCKKPPSIGDMCSSGNTRCFEEASYCDSTTLVCVAGKADGEACTTSLQCQSENCDFTTGTGTGTCGVPSCSG